LFAKPQQLSLAHLQEVASTHATHLILLRTLVCQAQTARSPAALGDALGQVTTRTSQKRRAVSLKRGGDSPEMCEKGRLGGEADREQNSSLPAQRQPIPVHKEDQLISRRR
jgi:hypothetical protein